MKKVLFAGWAVSLTTIMIQTLEQNGTFVAPWIHDNPSHPGYALHHYK
ncbi:MAG TPA: hypothetical protein VK897_27810 [Anaerolineales bacterium]|nr:hypothetical protein [Anaerolineales bacterium]